ncbi:unnamed protein product [Symbiodinium sp. CCMP2592]|nr:unnamed protein product [Symbiodinium sp. CCMP2592]
MSISPYPAPMSPEDAPQDDLERELESLMHEDADLDHEPDHAPETHDPPPPPPKRLRGAQLMLSSTDTDQRHAQVSDPPKVPAKMDKAKNVLDIVAEYEGWSLANHPDFAPRHRMFMSVAKFICDMNAANYMMSNVQKLTIFMLIDGGSWRAHKRQLFHLRDGAWDMADKLTLEAWDLLSALEGLFVTIASKFEEAGGEVKWSWSEASEFIRDTITESIHDGDLIDVLASFAKQNSDHVRMVTSNKTWKATWARRVADMVASYRKAWETNAHTAILSRLFLQDCETPMPKSQGICFDDIHLTPTWDIHPKSEACDCYVRFDYPYFYENMVMSDSTINVDTFKEKLRLFITSLYYKNEHAFQVKLCFLCAAFQDVCTGKMLFQIGRGGDGKGMEAVLDAALFGSLSSASLDCGVFLDRMEFRKSAELAWNKSNIRIQEMDTKVRFLSDIWKRFIVDEEIDCRVNYGFTTKRRFGTSLKIQEVNYENVPVIEESRDMNKACEQLRRRVVCIRMGNATYTPNPAEVDHKNGLYLLIPQDELTSFLRHPVTAALYLREWCLPFFQENSLADCLKMLHDLKSIDDRLEADTQWLAAKLSGRDLPPPGNDRTLLDANDEIVELVHGATPHKSIIKEYLLHKIEELPGCIASSRGRTTKLQTFVSAIDHSAMKLFKQLDHNSFEKLQINWAKLKQSMIRCGGQEMFGNWMEWTCPFDLNFVIQSWDGNAFHDYSAFYMQHCTSRGNADALLRPLAAAVQESVELEQLRRYAEQGHDRRQELLEAYIHRHDTAGFLDADGMSVIEVEYYTRPCYGRLLARGVSGQKLTREARAVAFQHCTEVDAACCHPRLLRQKLMDLDAWSDAKYVMLSRFIKNYKSWRQCIADYMDISLDDAKVERIRLFYGGKPTCSIPFLLKLCSEIQLAAQVIVHHESSRRWQQLYSDRRNPEFSRLSGILSFDEASMLAEVSSLMGDSMCVLLFDGGYIRCRDLHDDVALHHALETEDSRVGTQIRRWGPLTTNSLPRLLVRRGLAQFYRTQDVVDYGNCLLTSLYYMEHECDLGELTENELDDGISAREFNLYSLHCSQRDENAVHALKWLPDGFRPDDATNGAVYVFHEQSSPGVVGHWWTAKICGETEIAVFDSTAPECLMGAKIVDFQTILEEIDGMNAFLLILTTATEPVDMPLHSAYDLRGAGPPDTDANTLYITAPICVECSSPLAPAHEVAGRVYTLSGLRQVVVTTKRCSRKSCRAHHHYNYRKVDGQKYHSLPLEDLEYLFVNSKVGFERTFLDYHDALQFRGGISHNAIEFAQSQTLWEDAEQHYRWHRECASAQLYYSVIVESTEMWGNSTATMRRRIFNIEIDDPLSNDFLTEYQDWWHKHQLSRVEWQKVTEVVMDGHEKVAAKCPGIPLARAGRPRKDGQTPQRQNGWFMAIDPGSGLILSVTNMLEPENNEVAKAVLNKVISRASNLNCVIYDKMCVCQKAFSSDQNFAKVKYWCVDRFHAKAHGDRCPCSPLLHRRLDLRLRDVNTSIAEQTFSWFRGYASSFNTKNADTHIFYVLLYVKKHNLLVRKDYIRHLNPFSARAKASKSRHVLTRPSSKKYHCRRPAASGRAGVVYKKPSKKVRKNHIKQK